MIIDAQAIEHLDILPQATASGKAVKLDGSLFGFLSRSSRTPFGKRMLKRWTVSPLYDAAQINKRLEAVDELCSNVNLRLKIQKRLTQLTDVERVLTRIYTYSVKQKVKAFYIDAQALNRLDEFYSLLGQLREIMAILKDIFGGKSGFKPKSHRLRQLVGVKQIVRREPSADADMNSHSEDEEQSGEEGKDGESVGIFPDYMPILAQFDKMVVWKQAGKQKVPEPVRGLDEEFDAKNEKVENIRDRMDTYIETIKKSTGCKNVALFASATGKFRYQIEFPSKHEVDLEEFTLTSKTRDKDRYLTETLQEMTEELQEAENCLKDSLVPFLRAMFHKFYENRAVFSNAVACIGELDCLCTLADVSGDDSFGPMCKPEVLPARTDQAKILELVQMRHPCVQMIMKDQNRRFIPNDIHIGEPQTLLITGPNMGGKSTLLRQTCLAAIMAQIGCFVAAESCRLTVVDRVFTRLGASDRILENKSTFFVELEETKAICELATANSFVIMDELGRGTSTFDGYAIAHSVLSYLINRVSCRTLFTTHYHMLVDDFVDQP